MKVVVMLEAIDLERAIGIDFLELLANTYDPPPSNGSIHKLYDLHLYSDEDFVAEHGEEYGSALVLTKQYLLENMPEWTTQDVYVHCSW